MPRPHSRRPERRAPVRGPGKPRAHLRPCSGPARALAEIKFAIGRGYAASGAGSGSSERIDGSESHAPFCAPERSKDACLRGGLLGSGGVGAEPKLGPQSLLWERNGASCNGRDPQTLAGRCGAAWLGQQSRAEGSRKRRNGSAWREKPGSTGIFAHHYADRRHRCLRAQPGCGGIRSRRHLQVRHLVSEWSAPRGDVAHHKRRLDRGAGPLQPDAVFRAGDRRMAGGVRGRRRQRILPR